MTSQHTNGKRPRVAVIQRTLTHYRVPFFEALRSALDEQGIDLTLVHGQPDNKSATKKDDGALPWATTVRNQYFGSRGSAPVWQPLPKDVRTADLVVTEQASRLLVNYRLAVRRKLMGQRLAYWGHGANLDPDRQSRLAERVKKFLTHQSDHFLAYTDFSRDIVVGNGYPPANVTVLNNAVDTERLRRDRQTVSPQDQAHLRENLGVSSENIAYFVGSLYPAKQLEFLLKSATACRKLLPDFQLLIIGMGPQREFVEQFAANNDFVHYLGPQYGTDLATTASISKVLLNPGSVGLNILDSFALATPLLTTEISHHGPEIAYLLHQENGILVPGSPSPEVFAAEVAALMQDPVRRATLQRGCETWAAEITVQKMADRFAAGIIAGLSK